MRESPLSLDRIPPAETTFAEARIPSGLAGWFASLSAGQRRWAIGSLAVAVLLAGAGLIVDAWLPARTQAPIGLTVALTVGQVASALEITGKGLVRELELPLDAPKNKPLQELGVPQESLDHAVEHILSHTSGLVKYFLFAALVLVGLVFTVRLGRPDGSPATDRRTWYPRSFFIGALVVSVVVCGFLLGKSPNPMEGVVKVFKALVGLYPDPLVKALAFAFFLGLAAVGNKLVCGWACPFGALQELIFTLPVLRARKGKRVPFLISNGLRGLLFVLSLVLMFGVVGGQKGFVLYHGLNPFNLFDRVFETAFMLGALIVTLLLSFVLYRPFCQFVCPFGFASWLVERFSWFRVRIDPAACTNCGACTRACPTQAAADTLAGEGWRADCFSCTRCLNVCPVDALRYGLAGPTAGEPATRGAPPQPQDGS